MNATLFLKELKSNAFSFLVITAVLALYIVSIAYMYDPEITKNLDAVMASMPELFAAFGMANLSSTMTDFMLNYLYGFLLTWVPLLLIMMIINRTIVRPIDRATLANLLSMPVKRQTVANTFALVTICALILELVLVVVFEIACSEALFPGEIDAQALSYASLGLLGLWIFMAGICFASACCFKDSRLALWGGGGVCLLLLLMQVLTQTGDELQILKDINPVTHFDPFAVAAGSSDAILACVILALAGICFFALGIAVFCKRDLNI